MHTYEDLANLIFPDITETVEDLEKRYILRVIDLFKRSDEDYVDWVFKFLCEEDFTYLSNIVGDDDWEALKTMIWNGDIE